MSVLPIAVADIIVVGILLISGLLALFRGFIREVLAVASWIGAIFATLYGIKPFTPLVRRAIDIPIVTDVAAGAIIFLVSLIAFGLISRAISRGMHQTGLGMLDRTLGFVFGIARGALIVCLAYLAYTWIGDEKRLPRWMTEARTLPLVQMGGQIIIKLIPSNMRDDSKTATRAPDATTGTGSGPRRGAELQTLLRSMMQPPATASAGGYNTQDRTEMEGTIQGIMQRYEKDPQNTESKVREIVQQNQSNPDGLKMSLENLLRQNQ